MDGCSLDQEISLADQIRQELRFYTRNYRSWRLTSHARKRDQTTQDMDASHGFQLWRAQHTKPQKLQTKLLSHTY